MVQNIKGRTCDLLSENWTMKYVRVLPSRGGVPWRPAGSQMSKSFILYLLFLP
jgi:hypothetical protein